MAQNLSQGLIFFLARGRLFEFQLGVDPPRPPTLPIYARDPIRGSKHLKKTQNVGENDKDSNWSKKMHTTSCILLNQSAFICFRKTCKFSDSVELA